MSHLGGRKCQACQFCRSRKVKCDGERPRCTTCRTQQRPCQYGEDRRHIPRTSRETVELLGKKVANLEDILSRVLESGDIRPHNDVDRAPLSEEHWTTHSPNQSLANVEPGEVNLTASQNNTEPSKMNALVQSDIGLSFHGPTSSFRGPASPASQTGSSYTRKDSLSASDRKRKEQEWRTQLFANTSLERQKEQAYMTERKFDLDGVDFETALVLFNLYWNHQHNTYLVTYRPAIMHSLAAGGIYVNKLLLNAIFYTGSLQSGRSTLMDDPSDRQTLGKRFYNRFQALLATEIDKSSIASVSALIVMGSALLARGRQTLGWLYCGIAYHMIVDLGLHVNPEKVHMTNLSSVETTYSLTSIDIEQQRRVFWGAYMNDRFQSLYFGRQPALHLIPGLEPSQELLDTYDELELWSPFMDPLRAQNIPPYTPQLKYNVTNRNALLRLAEITSEVVEKFYTPKLKSPFQEAALQELGSVQAQLDDWLAKLPEHLRYDPDKDPVPPPHRFYPHTTFHTLNILLYRPYLREGHLSDIALDENTIKQRCISSAMQIYRLAQAYRDAFTLHRAPYLFSYALFSAATVIPLHWEDNPPEVGVIMFFWNALKELQEGANFGFKKPILIIRGMFERAGLDLNTLATLHETMRESRTARPIVEDTNSSTERELFIPDIGLLGVDDCRDFHRYLMAENLDSFATADDMGLAEQPDMLYGLFG